jgi:hypothetical protein
MKGKVEVFAILPDGSEKLLVSESNLVVNGAGENIVDMLTTPSSVLGIEPRVMDTSNWRFGALSFGPAAGSFSGNAYFFPEDKIYMKEDDLCNGVRASVSSLINQISSDKKLRVLWASATIGAANGATASSYTPPYRLPSYPDPLDQKLEDASTSYAIVSGDGTQCFGQFENRIQFAPNDASSYFQGAYPRVNADSPTDDTQGTAAMLVSSYEGDFQSDTSANMIVFRQTYGPYNGNQVMDYRGYITTQYNSTNPGASLSRVSVSGSTPNTLTGTTSQVTMPTVTVTTTIAARDTWLMNLYGGLHQIGLWNMDTPTALLANSAPFLEGNPTVGGDPKFINTTTGVTKQEYKLFAKKSFTNNLTRIQDNGGNAGMQSSQTLKIEWTLDLRSQPW